MTTSASLLFLYAVTSAHGALLPLDERWGERDAPAGPRLTQHPNSNLTISPWPEFPYALPLTDGFSLNVYSGTPYTQRPLPGIAELQGFIRDFAQNLEQAYPPPALAPREAGQTSYDTDSYTKWHVEENLIHFISSKAPTKIVLAALAQLAREVARHGPPAEVRALIVGRKTPGSGREYPYNALTLSIDPLGSKDGEDGPPRIAVSADT